MSDITLINDSEQSSLVTNGLAKNGELYLKKAGSTDAGSIVVYDNGSWRTFANDAVAYTNNYSVDLDGTNDYMTAGTISALNSASAFTISMWVKLSSSGGSVQRFIDTTGSSSSGVTMYQGSAVIDFLIGNGSSSNAYVRSTNTNLKDDAWHHLVGVYDGSTTSAAIYIDGVASNDYAARTMPSTTNSAAGGSAHIGSRNNGSTQFLNGLMDEMAIFNAALSAADITAIYNSGVPTDLSVASSYDTNRTANLVHWWRMGENDSGTGTTVTDQGSGGNNLTLTNGPTFSTTIPS